MPVNKKNKPKSVAVDGIFNERATRKAIFKDINYMTRKYWSQPCKLVTALSGTRNLYARARIQPHHRFAGNKDTLSDIRNIDKLGAIV